MCVCARETWAGGAYSSCRVKSPRDNLVLGYDALSLDDVSDFNFSCRVYGTVKHDPMFAL